MIIGQPVAKIAKSAQKSNLTFVQEIKRNWVLYLMALPGIIALLIFSYGPLLGISVAFLDYNPIKALFQYLNGTDTMDTTAWIQGFEKYRWNSIFGFENYWVGKPLYGINRAILGPTLVQEYVNGKLEPKWVAPLPYDLVTEE